MEYIALRALVFIVRILPYRAALALGWLGAWIAFHIVRFRVRAATTRIVEVFGERYSICDAGRIAWLAWRNFVFGVLDLMRAPIENSEAVRARLDDMHTVEKIRSHIESSGSGAIIALPHMGAWEMAAFAASSFKIPLFTFAARQKNTLADGFLNRIRQATGVETILRDSSVLRGIIQRIRTGKVLAILPDLRAPTDGLSIRFFGKEANIASGMGFIAHKTGVPVFPVVITRTGWTSHRIRAFDPIIPDPELEKQADAHRITQAVFDIFDRCIRDEPEQWFWFNKRWILDPLDAERG